MMGGGGAETSIPTKDPNSNADEIEGIEDITSPSQTFGPSPSLVATKEVGDQKVIGSSPLVIGASNESTTTNTPYIKFDENTVLESLTDQTYHVAVNMIRLYNMIHCQGLPHTLPEHVCKVQDSSLRKYWPS
jgi:hypothetical protein